MLIRMFFSVFSILLVVDTWIGCGPAAKTIYPPEKIKKTNYCVLEIIKTCVSIV
jgi:hypothetical protein